FAPSGTSINNLRSFLEARLHKPGGISIRTSEISSPALAPYSIDDIVQVENEFRTVFNQDGTLAVFGFIADGDFADDENVLGAAYRNTSFVLFGSKIDEVSGGLGQPSQTTVETTVLTHEFGHLMGLVNNGTPLQSDHQDTAHGKHCDVEDCLMYFTAESGDAVSNLIGGGCAPGLDSQCIADLRANGGK
ncbi:MAG: hypothetical protein R3350_08090, partial [Saprospiraceae bacterium]|nr:hypothetical protein [Saprospiraceae bacterium]